MNRRLDSLVTFSKMLSASPVAMVKTEPPKLVTAPPASVASVKALPPSSETMEKTCPPTVVTKPSRLLKMDATG